MADSVAAALLALALAVAVVSDLRVRKVPNALTGPAVLMGFALGAFGHGPHGLRLSLEGAALTLPLYALRGGLGAGDVKLLAAVGALAGPRFALWTLLGTGLAGGLLGAAYLATRGLDLRREGWAGRRLPYAPAVALGAAWAALVLHGSIRP